MPFVVWITGLPGSGKSTVADALKETFPNTIILRMDELRRIVTPNPSYSEEERDLLYRALVYFAATLYENNHNVFIDATANLRKWRELARKTIKNYGEVYLRCPLEECKRREKERSLSHEAPTDIYQKAREGWPVPGINVPYEEPVNPEVIIDCHKTNIDEAVKAIRNYIQRAY